ncbi:MAG: flavodoxin domain-containing protein [Cardiobacteriaceae bacterium]|nr:flavodoxin domain-containing protein [Cardiobacteriaceae bacterium]
MTAPISSELLAELAKLDNLNTAWLSGYLWAIANNQETSLIELGTKNITENKAENNFSIVPKIIKVFSASNTGNCRKIAQDLAEKISVEHVNIGDFKAKKLTEIDIAIFVVATYGDGEPVDEAISFYKDLKNKKIPSLDNLQFAILGLGDSSYPKFCQAAKDLETYLLNLSAKEYFSRLDLDVDFQEKAQNWIKEITAKIRSEQISGKSQERLENKVSSNAFFEQAKAAKKILNMEKKQAIIYSRDNPYQTEILTNQRITAQTCNKDIRHIELDISSSGITYNPGDLLGIFYKNNLNLVKKILSLTKIKADERVKIKDEELSIEQALVEKLDITKNSLNIVKKYAEITKNNKLEKLLNDAKKIDEFVNNYPVIALFSEYKHSNWQAQVLADLFLPIQPRLYSIASSQAEVGEELHLCIGIVDIEYKKEHYFGGATGYIKDLQSGEKISVFVQKNNNFNLPAEKDKDIIMIAAGTGIAPFRAFLQSRENNDDDGQNWLFFGNWNRTEDFLYQTEWQTWKKNNILHKYNFAWSRMTDKKVYVQDKIREEGESFWQWLENGAYIYLCGSALKMAKEVEQAILEIIQKYGKLNSEEAENYLDNLRENKRYQKDVY